MTGCRNPSTSWRTCHSVRPVPTQHHRRMASGELVHNTASSLLRARKNMTSWFGPAGSVIRPPDRRIANPAGAEVILLRPLIDCSFLIVLL